MGELTTVADDEAVVHTGTEARVYDGLPADTVVQAGAHEFRTLPRRGELLARFTTVNDVHFGETDGRPHRRRRRVRDLLGRAGR
jgi:3',5'-cyclic-AMP phosphodiesterase